MRKVRRKSATPKKTKLPPLHKRDSISNEIKVDHDTEEEKKLDSVERENNSVEADQSNQNLNTVETAQVNEEPNKLETIIEPQTEEQANAKTAKKVKKHKAKRKVEEDSKSVRRSEKYTKKLRDHSPAKLKMSVVQSKYLFEIYKSDSSNQQNILKKKKHRRKANKTSHILVNSNDINVENSNGDQNEPEKAEKVEDPEPAETKNHDETS